MMPRLPNEYLPALSGQPDLASLELNREQAFRITCALYLQLAIANLHPRILLHSDVLKHV